MAPPLNRNCRYKRLCRHLAEHISESSKRQHRCIIILFVFFMAAASAAYAEVEKIAIICEEKICLKHWPKMSPLVGWHQDLKASNKYNSNMFVRDDVSMDDVAMYGNAPYKPSMPQTKSVADLIEDDRTEFPHRLAKEVDAIKSADGVSMRSFTFFPKPGTTERWEQVTYGDGHDKDGNGYFLLFTLSAKDKSLFDKFHDDYMKFVSSYSDKPAEQQKQ